MGVFLLDVARELGALREQGDAQVEQIKLLFDLMRKADERASENRHALLKIEGLVTASLRETRAAVDAVSRVDALEHRLIAAGIGDDDQAKAVCSTITWAKRRQDEGDADRRWARRIVVGALLTAAMTAAANWSGLVVEAVKAAF
jgi:hypothetical protein